MRVERVDVDSRVLGCSVFSIQDFEATVDFEAFESEYVRKYDPAYVSCKIPIERIADVHILERAGFNLIECQIRSRVKLRKLFDVSEYNYAFERANTEKDLSEILEIAGTTFVHDRFSVDPVIAEGVAGERYRQYVLNSFRSPDDAVYRLIDGSTRQTVAFKTHRYVSKTEVLFLLGGVDRNFKNLGLGLLNSYYEFNELIHNGITRGVTHISAGNYQVFNLEFGGLGFRIVGTFVVLRKIYGALKK